MGKQVLLDCRAFIAGDDVSGSSNKIEIAEKWEAKKVTNWRSGGAEENMAGLGGVSINAMGQWEAGDPSQIDDTLWAGRRAIEPWSMGPSNASDTAAGNLMYLTQALRTSAKLFDAVGEVAPWEADATGSWPLVRGSSMHPSGVPRTALGSGTAVQAGAVPVGRYVYANLHVLSVTGTGGPGITVTIQSDDNAGFTTPIVRGSFIAKTAVGGEALRIAGPFTDDWWRVTWVVSGVPSILFLATLGIE